MATASQRPIAVGTTRLSSGPLSETYNVKRQIVPLYALYHRIIVWGFQHSIRAATQAVFDREIILG